MTRSVNTHWLRRGGWPLRTGRTENILMHMYKEVMFSFGNRQRSCVCSRRLLTGSKILQHLQICWRFKVVRLTSTLVCIRLYEIQTNTTQHSRVAAEGQAAEDGLCVATHYWGARRLWRSLQHQIQQSLLCPVDVNWKFPWYPMCPFLLVCSLLKCRFSF